MNEQAWLIWLDFVQTIHLSGGYSWLGCTLRRMDFQTKWCCLVRNCEAGLVVCQLYSSLCFNDLFF